MVQAISEVTPEMINRVRDLVMENMPAAVACKKVAEEVNVAPNKISNRYNYEISLAKKKTKAKAAERAKAKAAPSIISTHFGNGSNTNGNRPNGVAISFKLKTLSMAAETLPPESKIHHLKHVLNSLPTEQKHVAMLQLLED